MLDTSKRKNDIDKARDKLKELDREKGFVNSKRDREEFIQRLIDEQSK